MVTAITVITALLISGCSYQSRTTAMERNWRTVNTQIGVLTDKVSELTALLPERADPPPPPPVAVSVVDVEQVVVPLDKLTADLATVKTDLGDLKTAMETLNAQVAAIKAGFSELLKWLMYGGGGLAIVGGGGYGGRKYYVKRKNGHGSNGRA